MEGHPLIQWYAVLRRADAVRVDHANTEVDGVRVETTDVVLGDLGGRRFGLSTGSGGEPVLCCLREDLEAVRSVPWTSAAMAFGYRGRDWIALSCKDARVRGSAEMNPVPVRLWIPVTVGRLDEWKRVTPKRLLIASMRADARGEPSLDDGQVAEVPMKIIGT